MEYTPRMTENILIARASAASSMVLLRNVQNTLPLLANGLDALKVAVFGIGQIFTPIGSQKMQPFKNVNILDGLCANDAVKPDGLLSHKYRAWALAHPSGEPMPLDTLSMEELSAENDAAIIVLSRSAEAYDPRLKDSEKQMISLVCKAFSRTILVIAAPGYLELNDEAAACGAIVFMGLAGQEAGNALADLLTGKVVPSGRLAHSWPMKLADFDEAAANSDQFSGYRYFDTFGKAVRYPFGCGLSYGAAEFGSVSVALDGCEVIVTAEVQNTGSTYPVSEVVQVYVSKPESLSEQPRCILDCFARTKLLLPGQSQTVQLRFPVSEFSCLREEASAFVLAAGYYDIRVGTDCRKNYLAGSILVTRAAAVQAVQPLKLATSLVRSHSGAQPYTYPEEAEELAAVRAHAIRLSDRNLPRRSRKKGRSFSGCKSDGTVYSFGDLKTGNCTVFQFVAGMDDDSLRHLVCGFGACPSEVDGALGASAKIEQYGIPAVSVAGGWSGLTLEKEITDDDGNVTGHRVCTAFPSPSTLACSFDLSLIGQVGRAVGREMREYGIGFWLNGGCDVQRTPRSAAFAAQWSEDPVVAGLCTAALTEGVQKFGAAILHASDLPREMCLSRSTLEDFYGLSFAIAAPISKAALLPSASLDNAPIGEDSAIVRSMILDWGFGGMFLAEGERYSIEPNRVELEKSALRILRVLTDLA